MTRLISFSDGTTMGNTTFVFETDVPIEELEELEKISNDVYINGGSEEDVPIWREILKEKGYKFDYVDECQHITLYGTSTDWLQEKYPNVKEHYIIDNQPM